MIHVASNELSRHLNSMQKWLDKDLLIVSPEILLVEFCFPNGEEPARFIIHHLSSLAKDPSASPSQKAVAKLLMKQGEHPEVTINPRNRLPPMIKLTYTNTDTGDEESTYALADIEFDDEKDSSESTSQAKLDWRHNRSARLSIDVYPSSFYQHERKLTSDFDEVEEVIRQIRSVSASETDAPHAHLAPLSSVIEKIVEEYVAGISGTET